MHRSLLTLPLLIACGGPETNVRNLVPVASVLPPNLDFGEVAVPLSAEQVVFVANEGQADLEAQVFIEGPDADVFSTLVTDITLPRDEEPWVVPVTFEPASYLEYLDATLVVTSNDDENPRIEVPLQGVGVFAPMPDIVVDPLTMNWGEGITAGSSIPMVLSIENQGDDMLQLDQIEQTGSGAFRVDANTDASNASVGPGENQPVVIYYEPSQEAGDNGTLVIPSNDPDEPEVTVTLVGNGGGTLVWPEAVIDCPNTSSPPQFIGIDGSNSIDPFGQGLLYSWTLLEVPNDSEGELTEFILPQTSLWTDLAGPYRVQLQVSTVGGLLSAPEICEIDAIPADDIHVELTWDTNNVDLDLHLLQNTSASLFDVPDDCNWCNKNPDWGDAGASDDPRLDLDDLADGPENINVLSPADGAYPVVVHYFDPIGGPATTATVTVWLDGVEVFRDSQILTRNEVWEVGQVNWPQATFGVYPVDIQDATRRQCQ